jgi:hypothetical protein
MFFLAISNADILEATHLIDYGEFSRRLPSLKVEYDDSIASFTARSSNFLCSCSKAASDTQTGAFHPTQN